MEVDGTSLMALANMLRGPRGGGGGGGGAEQDDPEPKGLPSGAITSGLNPGSINAADRPRTAGKGVPKTATKEIWGEEEVECDDEHDLRLVP